MFMKKIKLLWIHDSGKERTIRASKELMLFAITVFRNARLSSSAAAYLEAPGQTARMLRRNHYRRVEASYAS